MSTGLEDQLRMAFERESDFVQPQPELASRVRASARRRRLVGAVVAAACAVVLVAAGATYLAVGLHQNAPATHHHRASKERAPRTLVSADYQIGQLAVSGRYLYLASADNDTLSAYDRATGKLLRTLTVPASPSALAVGPGGLIWLAFYPGSGEQTGIWLLSPDLRQRSTVSGIQTAIILPYSRTAARIPTSSGLVAPTLSGLVTVRMPPPGQAGRASSQLDPGTNLGPSRNIAPGTWAGLLDGRVTVQVTDWYGLHSHVVTAGQPRLRFGGSPGHWVGSVTSTGSAIWAEIYTVHGNQASSGPLVRLDGRLQPTTPRSVRTSPVLTRTEQVWSAGHTVWVATAAPSHALVCFRAGATIGPITTVTVHGQVLLLAATAQTVYVSTGSWEFPTPSTVVSYPVPAACR
jgi:hypothetical protein